MTSRRLVVLLVLLVGCGGADRRDISAERYHQVREAWSREAKLLDCFELQVVLRATYVADSYRTARQRHIDVIYANNSAQRDALAKQEADAREAGEELLVGIFVPDRRWDKLQRNRSPWNLRLLVDELEPVASTEIIKFKRPQPEVDELYPQLQVWDRFFRVIFPRHRPDGSPTIPAGARILRLALDGPIATAQLKWDLAECRAAEN